MTEETKRPLLSDLHVGEVVQIYEGPFAPRTGLLHALNGKTAQVRMPNMWRRDILVTVPVPFLATVSDEWKAEAEAKLKAQLDPLAYLDRQLAELRERGLESFSCVDPIQVDFQIQANHVWFTGKVEEAHVRGVGLDLLFVGNVWTARIPVLLMHREAYRRSARTQGNPNLIPTEAFRDSIPKIKRKQIQNPSLCYRGRRYQPEDLWGAAKTPYENHPYYSFRRGHLVPLSVQFVTVPELGVELETEVPKGRRKGMGRGGKVNLISRSSCYALPLVSLAASRYLHATRWGLLSAQYHQLGPRPSVPLVGMGPDQAASVKGEG